MGLGLSSCVLDQPVTMRGARLPWLTLFETNLPGLMADGCYVEGSVELVQVRIHANCDSAAVQFAGAYIGGAFDCGGTKIVNEAGPALMAADLKVNGSFDLSGLEAQSNCRSGAVQLLRALIGGTLRGDSTALVNESGAALIADNLKVVGAAFLRHGQYLGDSSSYATVQLRSTNVGGNFEFNGTFLSNRSGAALSATGMQVDGAVFFCDTFYAVGYGQPTLNLEAAQISGALDFEKGRTFNSDGLALNLASASVTSLCLPGDATCRSGVMDDPKSWKGDGQLRLDGLTYSRLDPRGADADQWLLWLHFYTPAYATQPYQQLASVYRAVGDEVNARRALIAQQDDLLVRGELGGHFSRAWHRLKGVAVGYGYQSWRAVISLSAVVLLAITLGLAAGHIQTSTGRFEAVHTSAAERPGTACSIVEQVGLGLDLSLPVINTGLNNQCKIDSTTSIGQAITVVGWLLQGLAWALATLVIAGYTGLIRNV